MMAETNYNNAVDEEHKTNEELKTRTEEHEDAVNEAARLKLECECEVQTEHANAWTSANSNNDQNAEDWKQAHEMLCVLDGHAHENCTVPAVPVVTQPTVAEGVNEAECATTTDEAHVDMDE